MLIRVRFCFVILALCLPAGCAAGTPPRAPATVLPRPSFSSWAAPGAPNASGATRASGGPAAVTGGWRITVYYTAVQRFHGGRPQTVTGCRGLDCADGDENLGEFPADFVAAVKQEGTGRTTAGGYLNWSAEKGYWRDTAARDITGDPLRPFGTAAADPDVLPRGATFQIAGCGRIGDRAKPPGVVCAALRRARWTVTDVFTPGPGGSRHIDVYIGEETGPDFTRSDWYLALTGASLRR